MWRIWLAIVATTALATGCNMGREHAQSGATQASTARAQPAAAPASTPSASDLLLQAIDDRRVVLLGEMHGTEEAPALAGQLVSYYATAQEPVVLGLEFDRNEQADVDRFLDSSGDRQARAALLAGTQWLAPHDGRDSKAMFDLIDHVRTLRASGADVRIVYFDAHDDDMSQRNRHMADTLRAAAAWNPDAMLLVLTGNVHAMTRRPPGDMYSEEGQRIEPPMTAGRYLSDLHPASIDIDAASGEYWACRGGQCGPKPVRPQAPRINPTLEKHAPMGSAFDYSLALPHFHASTPAVQAPDSRQSTGHAATAY